MGLIDDLKKQPLTPERFNKYHEADRNAALVTFRVLFIAIVIGMLSLLFFFFIS